jgi:hypothetical protein
MPFQWATTQNDLGIALSVLGERENDTAKLEEAVAAHREALKVQNRESEPLAWAGITGNLGVASMDIAHLKHDVTMAREAVVQIETARNALRAAGDSEAVFYEHKLEIARSIAEQMQVP